MKPRHVVLLAVACALVPDPARALTINVEIDWLKAAGHSHKPSVCELQAVVAAFAAQGHTLNYVLSDEIPEDAANMVIDFTDSEGFDSGDGDWYDLESVYRDNGAGWHYCIFGHNYSDDGEFTSSSGLAELDGDDLLVSLASFANSVGTTFDRAGTFMHELGHNLGLEHAGDQDEDDIGQYKPNLVSLMAYRYQLRGVRAGLECMGLATPEAAAGFRQLDYSHGARPSLDEDDLCEADGIGLGTGVDWNCSGGIADCGTSIARDLSNGNDWCTNAGNRDEITDYDDWSNISDAAFSQEVMSQPQRVIKCVTPQQDAMVSRIEAFTCTQPAPCEEAPVLSLTTTGGNVDANCVFTASYSVHITNTICGIDPTTIEVTATSLDGRATVGTPTVNVNVVGLNEVDVTGQVAISAVTACPARVRIRVEAGDGCGQEGTDADTIEVNDTMAPTIAVTLSPTQLWPPNHRLVDISATVNVDDNCPVANYVLSSVSSDEPENGTGDGDTAPDVVGAVTGTADVTFQLRAERSGTGDGRVYTVAYTATDGCGNTTPASATVTVAHDHPGAALAASGYSPSGNSIDPRATEFAVVVPSIVVASDAMPVPEPTDPDSPISYPVEVGTLVVFDATRIGPAVIANVAGMAAPLRKVPADVNGDGQDDLVLVFSSAALRDLTKSPQAGRVALYMRIGWESWSVADILALGPRIDLPAGLNLAGGLAAATGELSAMESRSVPSPATGLPFVTRLVGAKPNPFRSGTEITLDLAREGEVRLSVFDVRGALVRELWSGARAAGRYTVAWDGHDGLGRRLATGTYIVRFTTGGRTQVIKAVLLR